MASAEPIRRTFRLAQIQNLLYRNRRGLSTIELATACNVNVRTIERDMNDLGCPPHNVPVLKAGHCWTLDPDYTPLLAALRVTVPEATALFLAARLLLRASDEANPFVTSAVARLATVLPQAMANHVRATLAAPAPPAAGAFVDVFHIVATGWALQRKVRLWHQSAGSANVHEYLLAPYLMEPSAPSFATYVIGYEELFFRRVMTFKLERVLRAELTDQSFDTPDSFDASAFLGSAWGIMGGENTVDVVLRFAPQATRRVKESLWHAKQTLVDCDDGGCTLTVPVSQPIEMVPWIRGWGHLVKVLAPPDLRAQVADEARKTASVYDAES